MIVHKQEADFRIGKRVLFSLEWVWLFLLTSFTAIKYSPVALHADVLMNSLMSLRNVTLFYWGQNRLLNVLPFLASPFRDPTLNLTVILFISSFSTFLLLLVIAKVSSRFIGNPAGSPHQTAIFLLISSLFILLLNSKGINEIVIGHIEYSMPFLFALLAVYLIWYGPFAKGTNYVLSAVLIFLSMGLNPSTLIILVFFCFSHILYCRKFQEADFLIGMGTLISFLAWIVISRIYGGIPYGRYELYQVIPGIFSACSGLIGLINIPASLLLAGIFFAYKYYEICTTKTIIFSPSIGYTFYAIGIISIFWIIFFSGNYWVVINDFNVRYFTYIIFGLFIIIGIKFGGLLKTLRREVSALIILTFICFSSAASYALPVPYNKFRIFEEVNSLSPDSYDFYAGDYWLVWPLVLRDQMRGKISYGFSNRAEADKESAVRFANYRFENTGFITTLCLKSKPEDCIGQARDIVGAVEIATSEVRSDKVTVLKIVKASKD